MWHAFGVTHQPRLEDFPVMYGAALDTHLPADWPDRSSMPRLQMKSACLCACCSIITSQGAGPLLQSLACSGNLQPALIDYPQCPTCKAAVTGCLLLAADAKGDPHFLTQMHIITEPVIIHV